MRQHKLLTLLFLASLWATSAAVTAQVDLPEKEPPPQQDAKPAPKGGLELPPRPRGDLAPRQGGKNEGDGLDLPTRRAEPANPPAPAGPPAATRDPDLGRDHDGAAAFIFREVEKVKNPDASVALRAVDSLTELGERGLEAARIMLWRDQAAVAATAGRTLLIMGTPEDHREVVRRLRGKLPARTGAALLRTLLERDPVLASPELLIELLDHERGDLRNSAFQALEGRLGPSHLHLLAMQLEASRGDTRIKALDLLQDIEDPAVTRLQLARLGDNKAQVAARAAELLATSAEADTLPLLVERALGSANWDRGAAYALLALTMRQEGRNERLLSESDVPTLLVGLNSPEPIIAGSCAVALAGIGFRSPLSREMTWLDLEVPHQLVKLCTGAVFHGDFTSLKEPGLRQLALITGQSLGHDGPAWQAWWTTNAENFRARRAILDVRPGESSSLAVLYRNGGGRVLRLVGPAAPPAAGVLFLGDELYLDESECEELVALLDREGVLGATRLPTRVDSTSAAMHVVDVSIAGQGKRFEVLPTAVSPWFERIEGAVSAVADRNRWQLYFDPAAYASQAEFFAAERGWWFVHRDPFERAVRLKDYVLTTLGTAPPGRRARLLEELAREYQQPGVATAADFAPLYALLEREPFYSGETRELIIAAIMAGTEAGEGVLAPQLSEDLLTVVTGRFGLEAGPELVRILEACGPKVVKRAAAHEQTLVRAVTASALGREGSPESIALLVGLLSDPEQEVEIAAVRALGENRIEVARTELLLRARVSLPPVRVAALRAVGRLGGEAVLDALMRGLAEGDLRIQSAAAEGLGDLADPESITLLTSMLARGRASPFFEPARRGLVKLGTSAHPEVLRLTLTGAKETRREAALLLAEQSVPEAASTLMFILTDRPSDARVAAELAVLSARDLRDAPDPAQAWWGWWDSVVHDDALAWFRGSCEREGLSTVPAAALQGEGTLDGALFLIGVMRRGAPHLVERARRELGRLLGADMGALPPVGTLREERFLELTELARRRYADSGR